VAHSPRMCRFERPPTKRSHSGTALTMAQFRIPLSLASPEHQQQEPAVEAGDEGGNEPGEHLEPGALTNSPIFLRLPVKSTRGMTAKLNWRERMTWLRMRSFQCLLRR